VDNSEIRIPNDWQGKKEITVESRKMAKQLAMAYYNFAKSILDEMGEIEGTKFLKKVLKKIAIERGEAMRLEATRLGLPFAQESMSKVSDLPKYAFPAEGHAGDVYCPYADFWKEKGELGQKVGLLWCNIMDPWKIRAFVGPTYKLWKYGKNLNLKDDCCGQPIPLTKEEVEEQERM
jgi:hypothetical protein